jgi:hypothetical protein
MLKRPFGIMLLSALLILFAAFSLVTVVAVWTNSTTFLNFGCAVKYGIGASYGPSCFYTFLGIPSIEIMIVGAIPVLFIGQLISPSFASANAVLVLFIIAAVLSLVASFGLLKKKKFGFWLTLILLIIGILSTILSILIFVGFGDHLTFWQVSGCLFIPYALAIFYLTRTQIRKWFSGK